MTSRSEILELSPSAEESLADRFSVKIGGCLEYAGSFDKCGYGRFSSGDRRMGAHRAQYALTYGYCDPALVILHSCDNPKCINPAHMRAASQGENIIDSMEKKRFSVRGVFKDSPPSRTIRSGRSIIGTNGNEILIFRRWHDALEYGFRAGPLLRAARGGTRRGRFYKGYEWGYAE